MSEELIEQLAKEHGKKETWLTPGKGYSDTYTFNADNLEAFAKAYQAAAPIDNVREALERLVSLKAHKDRNGKDYFYNQNQPLAWEQAIRALIPSTQAPNTSGVRDETK
jgi:hypothetical protein